MRQNCMAYQQRVLHPEQKLRKMAALCIRVVSS
jgi:hypothetical protein